MKMHFKRLLSLFLCCALVFGAAPLGGLPLPQHGFWGNVADRVSSFFSSLTMKASAADDYLFDAQTGTLTINTVGDMANYSNGSQPWYSQRSSIKKVVIGDQTTSVGNYAFYNFDALEEVVLPDTITVIGSYAFYSCDNLVIDRLPSSLTTLGSYAFRDCTSISEMYIPKSLKDTNVYPFSGCSNLSTVSFEEGTTEISSYLFAGCTGLKHVDIPDTVTAIESNAFFGDSGLATVTLSNALASLSSGAFGNCTSITEIHIPKSLKNTGEAPFNGCSSLSSVSFEEGTTEISSYLFEGCTGLKHIDIPDTVTAIGYRAFYGDSGLESVTFSNAIAGIGSEAFYDCVSLQAIELGDYVTSIGYRAFCNCTAAETLKLSKRLDSIGYSAFYNCDALTEVTIPASVTRTDQPSYEPYSGVFAECDNLKKAIFADGMTRVPDHIFGRCTGLEEIVLPNTITDIGGYAFARCSKLVIDRLPPDLIRLGGYAFENCTSITEMYIPKSLQDTVYNYSAGPFYGCSNLTTVAFEEGTTEVSSYLFDHCTGLINFDIPDTVTAIENNAFSYDSGLETVTFSSAITSIGSGAFYNCVSLQAIEMGDYVTSIGAQAFSNCTAAQTLKLSRRLNTIGYYAFENCDALTEVTIPASVTRCDISSSSYKERGVFRDCDNLKKAIFADGMTRVPDYIFGSCTGLEEVVLPETVTAIGSYAFHSTRVEAINLHDAIVSIGDYAFVNCPLSSIDCMPKALNTIGERAFQNTGVPSMTLFDKLANVGRYAFCDCQKLASVEFKNPNTTINQGVFSNCPSLSSVQLPENLTVIENYLFDGCRSLRSIDIPVPVRSIGDYAFRKSAMESVMIVNNVASVGSYAFYDCDSLTGVTLSPLVTSIGSYSFAFCEVLTDITINTNTITSAVTTVIAQGAFSDSPSLEVVVLPKCVKTIGANAFHNSPRLRQITIPITVTTIESTAFSYPDRMIIKGVKGTAAERYAQTYDYEFVDISNPITGLVLKDNDENKLSIVKGSYYTPEFDYYPKDTTDLIVLTTDNAAVAYITDNRIFGNTQGTATITATASSGLTYDFTVNVNTVDSIEITSPPTKTVYEFGQEFDSTGLVVTAHFSDGSSNPVTDYTLSGYNAETYGKQTVKVTYGGKTATFEVEVLDDRVFVEGIEITTLPDKLTYKIGEKLITDGMVVTAAYSNGASAAVTGYTTSAINVLKPGKQTVTVTYEGFTDSFEIEVFDFYVTGIELASPPLKTEYYVGDTLNTEGISLSVTYSDNTQETVTSGFTCSPVKLEVAGRQQITVSYVDEETSFYVNVANVEVEAITVSSPPAKTTYYAGDTLNTRGLKLTVKYNSGKTETVTSGFECTPKLLTTPGTQKITVVYGGSTAAFNVAVLPVEITGLEIKTLPRKVSYFTGSRVDMTGFEMTASYNNGSSETVTKGYTYTPDMLTTEGTTTVTVTYKEKTVQFHVTVRARAAESIAINTLPDKVVCNVGSALDETGLSIKVNYNDGTDEIINSGFTCSPAALNTAGTQTVQVTYNGLTTSFEVAVNGFNTSNRFRFANSYSNFCTSWSGDSYFMTDEDMTKLVNYIKKIYDDPAATVSNVQDLRYSSWGGSCYGMAAAAVLDFKDQIAFNENFGNRAATMYDVNSPSTSKTIMSAINYYMVSQRIGAIRNAGQFYFSAYSSWSNGLRTLVERAEQGQPFLFCYWFSAGGHAIVAYGCEQGGGGTHNILAYDNRYPNDTVTIAVDANYTTCTVKTPYANESCSGIEFYPDMTGFDMIDIDGPNNDFSIRHSGVKDTSYSTYLYLTADSSVTVTNASGETLKVTADSVSGSMEILSTHMIVSSTEDGDPAPLTLVFEVGDSSKFTFTSTTDNAASVAVKTANMYASCTFESGAQVTVEDKIGVTVEGESAEYKAALSSVNHDYDTVTLAGKVNGKAALVYNGSNISAQGIDGANDVITVYSRITDVDVIEPFETVNGAVIRADGDHFKAEEISRTHTLTWNVDGNKTVVQLKTGDRITKPADPSKPGYVFSGWSAEVPETMPDADLEFTAVFTPVANPTANARIKVAGQVAVDYKTKVTITATASNLDPAYHLVLVIDGREYAGTNTQVTCEYGELKKDVTYSVKIVDSSGRIQKDAAGNELQKDGGKITCNDSFFKKIKAFVLKLFGMTPTVEVSP